MSTDHTHQSQTPLPFAELAAMYQRLEERGLHETVEGSMVKELFRAAGVIESVHSTAAEMQLGAEGFDNTESAGLYRRVQEHLVAAAREMLAASAALKGRLELWADLSP